MTKREKDKFVNSQIKDSFEKLEMDEDLHAIISVCNVMKHAVLFWLDGISSFFPSPGARCGKWEDVHIKLVLIYSRIADL